MTSNSRYIIKISVTLSPALSKYIIDVHRRSDSAERRKSNAHQRETTVSNNDSQQLRPFSKWELLLKERICSQRSEFFPLRVVPEGIENHIYHIRCAPLSVTIFITHVCILRDWSYANVYGTLHWSIKV